MSFQTSTKGKRIFIHFQYSVIILLIKGGQGATKPSVGLQTCSHNSEWMKLRRLRSTDWDSAPVARLSFLFSPCEAGGRECSVYQQPGRGWWQSHTTCRRFLHIGRSERFHWRAYGLCCPASQRRTPTACCRVTYAHCKSGSSFWGTYVLDVLQITSAKSPSPACVRVCMCSIVPLAGFGCCYSSVLKAALCISTFSCWPIVSDINMRTSPAECESAFTARPHTLMGPDVQA